MAKIYKIIIVKITVTLAIKGFAPPPLCYIVCSWYFPPFYFFFSVTYLKKKCKGKKKFYKNEGYGETEMKLQVGEERLFTLAKFYKRAEVLNFKIARGMKEKKFTRLEIFCS